MTTLSRLKRTLPLASAFALATIVCGCDSGSSGGSAGASEALMFPAPIFDKIGRVIAVADIYGDGSADVITTESQFDFGRGAIRFNQATLVYETSPELGIEPEPTVLLGGTNAVVDLNGDGLVDLVGLIFVEAGGSVDEDVAIRLGVPEDGFSALQRLELNVTHEDVFSVCVVHANADGIPDLSVSTRKGPVLLTGQGDGTFVLSANESAFLCGVIDEDFIADFDGDGIDDFIRQEDVGDVRSINVFLVDADQTPSASATFDISIDDFLSAARDLNGDGIRDLVFSSRTVPGVISRRGNGDGTFGPEVRSTLETEPGLNACCSIHDIADLNLDGLPDLLIRVDNDLSHVALGNGDGTFSGPLQSLVDFSRYHFPFRKVEGVLDINQDGDMEALLGTTGRLRAISLPLGSDSDLVPMIPIPNARYWLSEGLELNGDAFVDLAIGTTDGRLLIYAGDASLDFSLMADFQLSNAAVADDMDGDGDIDFRGGPDDDDPASNPLQVVENLGSGNFTVRVPTVDASPVRSDVDHVADVDGDGVPDLVLETAGGNAAIAYGVGDLVFEAGMELAAEFGPVDEVVDLNRDGLLDLVAQAAFDDTELKVMLGQPGRTFSPIITSPIPPSDGLVVAARRVPQFGDITGDGFADLVDFMQNDELRTAQLYILPGIGNGTFGKAQSFNIPDNAFYFTIVDVDGDDDLDVVAISLSTGNGQFLEIVTGYVVRNDGPNGVQLTTPVDLQRFVFPSFSGVDLADIDGNGIQDLVAFDARQDSFSRDSAPAAIALGLGDGTFKRPLQFDFGAYGPQAIADFDNDGDGDVAVVRPEQEVLVVHENRLIP